MNYNIPICKCGLRPVETGKSTCKKCRKEYDAQYFKQHSVTKSASAAALKRELLKWYRALKHNTYCMACNQGPFHFCQLDYDHIPGRGKKLGDVSKLVRLGYTKEKILAEIQKCQKICKNCHSMRTFNRRFGHKVEGEVV